jgi:TPR repeat protein
MIELKRPQEAACWGKMGADAGDANAQGLLATLYYKGVGVPVSFPNALNWARKAVTQDNFLGERCLSRMYATGSGVPKDAEQAKLWNDKADHHLAALLQADQQAHEQARQKTIQSVQAMQQQSNQPNNELAGAALLFMLWGAMGDTDSGGSPGTASRGESTDQMLRRSDRTQCIGGYDAACQRLGPLWVDPYKH